MDKHLWDLESDLKIRQNMEYNYKGTVFRGDTPIEIANAIMAKVTLTDQEAKAMTFAVYKAFGVWIRLWPTKEQRVEDLKSCLRDAYVSGISASDIDSKRRELARLEAMTDEEWDKEQEDYLLNGYSDAELLSQAKDAKTREIEAYDTSTSVNGFKLNGAAFWLDKATRVGLMNSTEITKAAGQETTDLWMGDVKLTIPCDTVIKLLSAIEMYALECFNTTARHKAEVQELKTVEEVEKYDIKEGYPKQLEINLQQ